MRTVEKLKESEVITLRECVRNHSKHHVRQRCQSVLWSDEGYGIKEISKLCKVRTRSIYAWFDRWEDMGIVGLMILPGRGRKGKLPLWDMEIVKLVEAQVVRYARSLSRLSGDLTARLGFEVSRQMLRRFLKKRGYSWKRFRKSLKSLQDPVLYAKKLAELEQLVSLYKAGFIDLYFADESGFSLQGHVPYGWQPKGEYIQITPQRKGSVQVFGLMSLDNELHPYLCEGSMDSDLVIAFMDDFCQQIKVRTVVVMDNASIHCSHKMQQKIEEWKEKDLLVFFLPPYSPHLNPIEILWRKIKYEWLECENIHTQKQLILALENILCKVGDNFRINFKHQKKMSNIFD